VLAIQSTHFELFPAESVILPVVRLRAILVKTEDYKWKRERECYQRVFTPVRAIVGFFDIIKYQEIVKKNG